MCAETGSTFSLWFDTNNSLRKLTVKMKKSSMNMAPNGRIPAINVLQHSENTAKMCSDANAHADYYCWLLFAFK